MNISRMSAFLVLASLVACGSPIFHKGSGSSKAPPNPTEIIPFNVTAGHWTLSVYAQRKDGEVTATALKDQASAVVSYQFSPAVVMPFSKSESLPLALTFEDVGCASAEEAVKENGKVSTLEGEDTYSVNASGATANGYSLVEMVSIKRGSACALLTVKNQKLGNDPLGPLPAATALLIYAEARSVNFAG